jgi:hypothetical protein
MSLQSPVHTTRKFDKSPHGNGRRDGGPLEFLIRIRQSKRSPPLGLGLRHLDARLVDGLDNRRGVPHFFAAFGSCGSLEFPGFSEDPLFPASTPIRMARDARRFGGDATESGCTGWLVGLTVAPAILTTVLVVPVVPTAGGDDSCCLERA